MKPSATQVSRLPRARRATAGAPERGGTRSRNGGRGHPLASVTRRSRSCSGLRAGARRPASASTRPGSSTPRATQPGGWSLPQGRAVPRRLGPDPVAPVRVEAGQPQLARHRRERRGQLHQRVEGIAAVGRNDAVQGERRVVLVGTDHRAGVQQAADVLVQLHPRGELLALLRSGGRDVPLDAEVSRRARCPRGRTGRGCARSSGNAGRRRASRSARAGSAARSSAGSAGAPGGRSCRCPRSGRCAPGSPGPPGSPPDEQDSISTSGCRARSSSISR